MNKINNSYRNMCVISDINQSAKLGFNRDDISSKGWPNVVKALSARVETDSAGNILKIDGKKLHVFPWCANYKLEGTEDFEEIKNGVTDEYRAKYYGQATWETMLEQEPKIWMQTEGEKKEVDEYWEQFKKREDGVTGKEGK